MPGNVPVSDEFLPASPVRAIPDAEDQKGPKDEVALCLSGGGYRAMLFHLGALWRLNQTGLLGGIHRFSSVSGGSITAGVLALKWRGLEFRNGQSPHFEREVVRPVRGLAERTIDAISVIGGVFGPGSVADKIAGAYRKHLFGDATLQDLPDDPPRFVINATNVQTGSLWRFSKPYMGDWRVGRVPNPTVELAVAIAASSAFPPVLSPVEIEIEHVDYLREDPPAPLHHVPYTTDVVLSDGGVYDNLGLETAFKRCKTVLVSDGGGTMGFEEYPRRDWPRHSIRVIGLIDNQVRSLRKRELIEAYRKKDRAGAYWGVMSDVRRYPAVPGRLEPELKRTEDLAATPTRLKRLDDTAQERLINWGYAICDTAVRAFHRPDLQPPAALPYPGSGI